LRTPPFIISSSNIHIRGVDPQMLHNPFIF
jgi:hypothetical protein